MRQNGMKRHRILKDKLDQSELAVVAQLHLKAEKT
jgi:hypothetical protein